MVAKDDVALGVSQFSVIRFFNEAGTIHFDIGSLSSWEPNVFVLALLAGSNAIKVISNFQRQPKGFWIDVVKFSDKAAAAAGK